MKYPLRPELRKYAWIQMPTNPYFLRLANAMMPIVQRGRKLDARLTRRTIQLPHCTAELLTPKDTTQPSLLIYYHGGAFLMEAAAYHRNLAQTYALSANCAVLFVRYRLAPAHPFPAGMEDSLDTYQWALRQGCYPCIALGGDSAGANLCLAVMQKAHGAGLPMPTAQLLVYPVADARMNTESMRRFTDTPLWNSKLNRRMFALYAKPVQWHDPLVSPIEADDLSFMPPTYIETCEFDCLHDEGIALAQRLSAEGVPVALNETHGTIHGYDIAEDAPYVKEQVEKRIRFIRGAMDNE